MELKHKTYVLTFTEFTENGVEDTDKRITIEHQAAYVPDITIINESKLVKQRMLDELKFKLGL